MHEPRMSRVLIVDDNELVARALELAMERLGHAVTRTHSPFLALELAKSDPPDVALLDFRMPAMNGFALRRAIDAALGARSPKVVFVSATPVDDLPHAERELDGCWFVRKPFHLAEVQAAVAAALETRSPPRPGAHG